MTRHASALERFVEAIELGEGGCWLWNRAVDRYGYARFKANGEVLGHRFAYLTWRGPIARNLTIDHLCRVRRCVNPEHLQCVSALENTMRGQSFVVANAAKTHCPKGHPYDEKNTFWFITARSASEREQWGRGCRICRRRQQQDYRRRKRLSRGAA